MQHQGIEPGFSFVRCLEDLRRFDPDEARVELAARNRLVEELEGRPEARVLLQESRSRELDLLSRELDGRNRELMRLHGEVEVRNRQVDRLQSELEIRGQEVARLITELDARGGETARLQTRLQESVEKIETGQRELELSRDENAGLVKELEDQNAEMERLKGELVTEKDRSAIAADALTHTRKRLDDVLGSRSWRFTGLLRALFSRGRRRP